MIRAPGCTCWQEECFCFQCNTGHTQDDEDHDQAEQAADLEVTKEAHQEAGTVADMEVVQATAPEPELAASRCHVDEETLAVKPNPKQRLAGAQTYPCGLSRAKYEHVM